jgi:hypothetical protein
VAHNLYLVFSRPPGDMTTPDYHRWYEDHARENIESPGFVSAQRYSVEQRVGDALPGDQNHLALYEFDGDYGPIGDHLRSRVDSGDIVLPDWFPQVPFASWVCNPVGDRLVAPSRR